jgi:3-mercaptopyruvate sulfurtransferase SseA
MNLDRCLSLEAFDALVTETPGLCLLDVGAPQRFVQAHLPGARLLNPRDLLLGFGPAPGNPQDPERLRHTLAEALGPEALAGKARVVLYDDEGGAWAGRAVWTLELFNIDAWAVLDGGLIAWAEAGRPLEHGPPPAPFPVPEAPPLSAFPNPEPWATLESVEAALDAGTHCLWDARSPAEYEGFQRTAARNGHIPGAVNVPTTALLDPQGTARLRADLAGFLREAGIDGTRPIITHCHSHHRSGLSYLAGRLLGWPIRAYAGSWGEWGNHPTTPITEGPLPHG